MIETGGIRFASALHLHSMKTSRVDDLSYRRELHQTWAGRWQRAV